MVKTLVWSVVLYGSETWTLRKEDIRIEVFEMWIWRRMERVSWKEHKTNEEILQKVGEERSLLKTIRERQRKWIGHIMRGDSLLRDIFEGRMEGRRKHGKIKNNATGLDDGKERIQQGEEEGSRS